MAFDKVSYDTEYIKKNVIRKVILFNRLQDEDMRLLHWVESKGNVNGYIKGLITEDIRKAGKQDAPTTDPESGA